MRPFTRSITNVAGVVLLKPYFASMRKVSYQENGKSSAVDSRYRILAPHTPCHTGETVHPLTVPSTQRNPPHSQNTRNAASFTAPASRSNFSLSRVYS